MERIIVKSSLKSNIFEPRSLILDHTALMTLPAGIHEARPLASEIKFVVDSATGLRIRDWARLRLDRDPFGEGPCGDQYRTSTVYFDTPEFYVFHRHGSYGRSKYRVRRYDGADVAYLERKLRNARMLTKRRDCVPLSELPRLAGALDGDWPGQWLHRRLRLRGLSPVCQIGYERVALVAARDTGTIRLTVDQDIRTRVQRDVYFTSDEGRPVLPGRMVVELKFRSAMPAVFKQLVEEFRLTPQRVSKYRMAVVTLNLAREDTAVQPVYA